MKNIIQPKTGIEQNSIQQELKRNLARFSVSFEYTSKLGYSKSRTSLRLAGRYPPLEKSPPHIYTHLAYAYTQALPKKPKELKFSHRSQTVNKFGEQIQGITKKTNYI